MSIWDRLTNWIGKRKKPGPRTFHFDASESLQVTLSTLASDEGRSENELIPDILAAGLSQYASNERVWKQWLSLTPREQEATALLNLGFSNGEMATRMGITEAGVKFHLRNVYIKFQVKNRTQLREKLTGWDFRAWLKPHERFHFLNNMGKNDT
jgi:DNA-binding CsgD family transcriptional regulator